MILISVLSGGVVASGPFQALVVSFKELDGITKGRKGSRFIEGKRRNEVEVKTREKRK